MAMKTIKGIIASFALIIVAGMLVTFTTKYVITQKREELYAYKDNTNNFISDDGQSAGNMQGDSPDGPMSSIMTKERYLGPIKAEEKVIADLWAGISDENSAMKVVLYECSYWDNQFDSILQLYYDIQSDEDIDVLKQEASSFVAERESLSQEAAKVAGETFSGLQYRKEHARLTKEKTYELIDRYFAEE